MKWNKNHWCKKFTKLSLLLKCGLTLSQLPLLSDNKRNTQHNPLQYHDLNKLFSVASMTSSPNYYEHIIFLLLYIHTESVSQTISCWATLTGTQSWMTAEITWVKLFKLRVILFYNVNSVHAACLFRSFRRSNTVIDHLQLKETV